MRWPTATWVKAAAANTMAISGPAVEAPSVSAITRSSKIFGSAMVVELKMKPPTAVAKNTIASTRFHCAAGWELTLRATMPAAVAARPAVLRQFRVQKIGRASVRERGGQYV